MQVGQHWSQCLVGDRLVRINFLFLAQLLDARVHIVLRKIRYPEHGVRAMIFGVELKDAMDCFLHACHVMALISLASLFKLLVGSGSRAYKGRGLCSFTFKL